VEDVFLERGQTTSSAGDALRGTRLLRAERRLRRRDGTELPISITTSPITTREWGMRGVLLSFVDLTPQKDMEQEIRRLDRLATLGRFTSAVAHEVRNPLSGIVAGVQYLRSVLADRPDVDEHLGFLERETARLDRIVDDLGRTMRFRRPQPVAGRVDLLLAEVRTALAPLLEVTGVRLVYDLRSGPAFVDPDQIQQVLLNLVRNAIEASPRDGVVRVVTEDVRDGGRRRIRITVTDEGEGLSEEIRDRLFEPFTSTKTEGTGLGLFISHGIVSRHGGELQLEDGEGGGVRVAVTLPAADPEEANR
jgi:two-component system sensor histidine kinase PilS (NtrC family)